MPVRYPAVASSGDTIYVFGGETASGRATDAIQAVELASGRATVVGHLPAPLDHAVAINIGGRVYVLGGTEAGGPSDRMLWFDPSRDGTSVVGRLPTPVTNAARFYRVTAPQ